MKPILLSLAIALLMVGCGEPDLSDPDVVEDATADAVDWSKLQDRSGVTYLPNTQKPFSGYAKRAYENGQVEILVQFKDGYVVRKKEWRDNGTPKRGANYKDGKKDGLETSWYENGQKEGETIYKHGKRDGLATEWYEDGTEASRYTYKDGKQDGLATDWYENGQKWYEAIFKDGKEDGPDTSWYENGQKESEGNFKDGKLMSAEVWKPNGENCPETNLKDGNGVVVYYNEDGTEESRFTYKDGEEVED